MTVSGRMSCWEDVSSGVPQGSVLNVMCVFFLPKTIYTLAPSPGKKKNTKNTINLFFNILHFSYFDLLLINWCGVGVAQT